MPPPFIPDSGLANFSCMDGTLPRVGDVLSVEFFVVFIDISMAYLFIYSFKCGVLVHGEKSTRRPTCKLGLGSLELLVCGFGPSVKRLSGVSTYLGVKTCLA